MLFYKGRFTADSACSASAMQTGKTRSNLLPASLTAAPPHTLSLQLAVITEEIDERTQQICYLGLQLLEPSPYQVGHRCNYRWKG